MSKTRVFVDEIDSLTPLDNSRNGNPAWQVTFKSGETMRTSPDASCAYGLNNPEFKWVPVEVTTEYKRGRELITYVRVVS